MPSLQYAFGAVTAACVLGVGYAIYFDQKRQNDPEFRRQLSKTGSFFEILIN